MPSWVFRSSLLLSSTLGIIMHLKIWPSVTSQSCKEGMKIKLQLWQDDNGGCHQPAVLALLIFSANTLWLVDIMNKSVGFPSRGILGAGCLGFWAAAATAGSGYHHCCSCHWLSPHHAWLVGAPLPGWPGARQGQCPGATRAVPQLWTHQEPTLRSWVLAQKREAWFITHAGLS